MYRSERRSLYRFLAIYLISTFVLFALGSSIFYAFEKHHLLDRQREAMKREDENIHHQIVQLHKSFGGELLLRVAKPYKISLLDIEKKEIFSNLKIPSGLDYSLDYQIRNGNIYYIRYIDPHHLGVVYLVMMAPIDDTPIIKLQKTILIFMLGAGIFFITIGYFLGRLFIAPMRESIEMMNSFIQDTTHELNTPISTILANLELMETLHNCDAKEEMKRIEIASKTLSRIYDDLTYLKLHNDYHRDIKPIDISSLLKERVLYFSSAIESKRITLEKNIEDRVVLEMDRDDAIRVIDNLLSNAIKYNHTGGILSVTLDRGSLTIKDSGIGIEEKDLGAILERFRRANKSEGGFGIGLNIVHQIAEVYGYRLVIKSKVNIGTEVSIIWEE